MDHSDEHLGTYYGFDLRSTWIITHDGAIAQRGRISIWADSETAARDEVERLTSPKVMRNVERLN